MTSSTPFSQELIDLIIDHLHDHPQSLSNCALVNRNWTPATRSHLYSSVNLHPGLLFYNSSKKIPRLERLLTLLKSPHSTIAQDIREVTLLFSLAEPGYLSYLVTRVIACLPALQSLNFLADTNPSWTSHSKAVANSRMQHPEQEYYYAYLEEPPSNWSDYAANFFTIVSSIPHLRRLKAVWDPLVQLETVPSSTYNSSRSFPPLRHLVVRGMKKAMMRWWLADEKRPPIRSVELQSVFPIETPLIGAFLEALGPSLVDLRVSFNGPRFDTENAFCKNVNLAHNMFLRTLEIGDVTLEPKGEGQVYFEWLFTILTQIESEDMKHIKIWLHVGEAALDMFDWDKLDDILSQPLFVHLETLTFGAYVFDRTCDFLDAVVKLLPSFRGRVQVQRYESCDYGVLQV